MVIGSNEDSISRLRIGYTVNFSGAERYSIPFFFSGRLNHEVAALPGCLGENEANKYPPTTVEAHMRDMYARTYV